MAYALRPGLHCCTVEGQTLCLDVAENRYFGLNAEAGNIVQRLADGEIQPIEDQQRLSTLVEKGILIEIAGDSEWRPPFCQPNADMDPVAGSAHVTELILATDPNLEGEATSMYISRLLTPLGVRVTRLARGLPMGSDLEYADDVTLTRALENRQDV